VKKIIRPTGGHILDIDSMEIADNLLSLAHNVNTRKGFPSRVGGRRAIYGAAPTDPRHLLNLQLNTFNWWMVFGTNKIWAVKGGSNNDITPAVITTIANTFEWDSTLLNGIPVFTNGKDVPGFWNGNGASIAVPLTAWPAGQVCKSVVAFRFHIFALNITNGSGAFENMLAWSDAAQPGAIPQSWTAAATNEAGTSFLADTPGRIVTGKPLGNQLMLYKPTSVYLCEYVGQQPNNIFTFRPVNRNVGTLSPHCVADLDTQHLIVGNDDVVLFDGVRVQSIADNRIKRYLANQIDDTNSLNAFVIRDLSKREVWVCVPESGNTFATVAHIYDERRDSWSTRDMFQTRYGTTGLVTDTVANDTWDADATVWDADLTSWDGGITATKNQVVTGQTSQMYVEDTADQVAVLGRVARYDLTFDDDSQRKLTSRVWIEGSGPGLVGMVFRLGARNSTDDVITWGSFVPRAAGGVPYEVCGRFISIEVNQSTTDTWTVDRMEIEAVYDGPY
jgi:hypothetical protein